MAIKKSSDFVIKFGLNLKKIRKARGITQEKLCELSGLALSQVGRIERGEINTSLDIIKTIADAMKLEVYLLFKFEENEEE